MLLLDFTLFEFYVVSVASSSVICLENITAYKYAIHTV